MNYRLAVSPADYKKCHSIMGEEGVSLTFPTVMAENEEGELVGFLSTQPKGKKKGIVIAGPLVLNGSHPMVAFRLGEMYDMLMKALGIFWLFSTTNPAFAEQLKRLGYVLHKEEDGVFWFKNREVEEDGVG